jgi:eukaryotic-like serine/threonine-protein kinase
MHDAPSPRRYRVVGLLGQGGFGRVYQARMVGPVGFEKFVAIKMTRHTEVPEELLQRFRDEARILGLVRDRALVSVDPPCMLNGRWAVVMDYVDGTSTWNLIKKGPFPPSVAIEVIGESARCLDSVYKQRGPDGQPLYLIHRDLKPGNIQVTPGGEIKLLDFGIARADFDHREAETTSGIAGTMGYIAPERLKRIELPAGDVYSLGAVLRVLVTGSRPRGGGIWRDSPYKIESTPALEAALALSAAMQHDDYAMRPTMREVEEHCIRIRRQLDGPTLRRWAEKNVPPRSPDPTEGDDLIGDHLVEQSTAHRRTQPVPEPPEDSNFDTLPRIKRRSPLPLVFLGLTMGAVLVVLAVLGSQRVAAPPPTPTPQAVSTRPAPKPLTVPARTPHVAPKAQPDDHGLRPSIDGEDEQPLPRPRAPTPAPAPTPDVVTPEPEVQATPVPEPEPTAGTPDPPPPEYAVTFGSLPIGAEVLVDGSNIGQTPLLNHPLPAGSHEVVMRLGDREIKRTVKSGRRAPTRYIWSGGDEWQVFY